MTDPEKRASLLAGDELIEFEHPALEGNLGETKPMSWEGDSLREVERRTILAALAEQGGNRTKSAEVLGISRNKLKEDALEGFDFPKGGTVLPIKGQTFPLPGEGRKSSPGEKGCKIIAIGPQMLRRDDWHQDCYFRGTDGQAICDPRRRRAWTS